MTIKIDETYDLKLSDGSIVQWSGSDGVNACTRYADSHPGAIVIAWRYPKIDFRVGMIGIIEP
jgi:hypothetical protein